MSTGTSNNFTFSFKEGRRISHIAIAFVNNTGTTFKYTPTDFSSGFTIGTTAETQNTTDGESNLSKLSVLYGGNMYPMSPYNLRNDQPAPGVISTTNDMMKAYMEYVINTDSLRDRNGALLDYSSWQIQQVYVFKTRQSIENVSNSCSINCEVKASNAGQTTNIFVLGLYDEFLTIGLDHNAQYTSYEVSAAPPI